MVVTSEPSACDGEDQARANGLAVDQHGAGTAHPVLATEVGAGQSAPLAQEVGQGEPRFDLARPLLAVDGQPDGHLMHGGPRRPPGPTPEPPGWPPPGPGRPPSRGGRTGWRPARPWPGDRARRDRGRPTACPVTAVWVDTARRGVEPRPSRPRPQRDHAVVVVELDGHGHPGDGEVAVAPGELLDGEADAAGPHREPHAGEQLVVRQGRGPQPLEEVVDGDVAATSGRGGLDGGIEGQSHRRVLGGRVGVGHRATERAAVADLEVSDERRGPGQQRHAAGHLRAVLDGGLGGAGPDPHRAVAALDAGELGQPGDVHQVLEGGQAQGQHGHQALTAGQQLGLVTQRGQQLGGVGDGVGPVVGEGSRLHVFVSGGVRSRRGFGRGRRWAP